MRRVLVTGANGFIGNAIIFRLNSEGWPARGSVRSSSSVQYDKCEYIVVENLSDDTNWNPALAEINVVIHTAARVHVLKNTCSDPLAEYRRVNVLGTLNLARQAASAGVRRFIYMSSIKVNGEATSSGQQFKASDPPAPTDPYAISKYEAEEGLRKIASETGMEVVIIRPPLVYGPGVKANFLSMMRWLDKGVPLPLGAIKNRRSLVALDNLVDLIVTCIDHPAAANQIFLASDGEDLSTTELLERLAMVMGKPARLIPVSGRVLEFGAALLGKGNIARRIFGSLQIDISKTGDLLGWQPPVTVDEALGKTAESFVNSKMN